MGDPCPQKHQDPDARRKKLGKHVQRLQRLARAEKTSRPSEALLVAQKLPLQKLSSQEPLENPTFVPLRNGQNANGVVDSMEELATATWSAARLRLQLEGLKDAMQEAGVAELDARDTAKTAWALARLRWSEEPLLTQLVSTATRVREELEPQGLANTL
eukprot:s1288_g3.t2